MYPTEEEEEEVHAFIIAWLTRAYFLHFKKVLKDAKVNPETYFKTRVENFEKNMGVRFKNVESLDTIKLESVCEKMQLDPENSVEIKSIKALASAFTDLLVSCLKVPNMASMENLVGRMFTDEAQLFGKNQMFDKTNAQLWDYFLYIVHLVQTELLAVSKKQLDALGREHTHYSREGRDMSHTDYKIRQCARVITQMDDPAAEATLLSILLVNYLDFNLKLINTVLTLHGAHAEERIMEEVIRRVSVLDFAKPPLQFLGEYAG